ncbi:MAG TPA: PQQ-binding-like beta-propeller repeat protein [Thermoanaerobaculia bacterium]|jgi:outer membrane protein assembly factor BamB|nr:PQQ-binding-like beta-propeller repeat protein [Thermoanaerobaculia bacterium]
MHSFARRSSNIALALCALLTALSSAPLAAQSHDPIEGRWWGKSGSALDRIDVGFEFKHDSAGDLRAYLYQPTLNFYGWMLPGVVHRTDSTYEVPEYMLKLTMHEGSLEGTYHSLKAPITLARAKTLPHEVPIPALPTGPGPKWRVKLGAPIYASAAIVDGIAYVGTTGGVLFAIDIANGKTRWTFAPGRPIYAQATATDSAVYLSCENGYLYKLDRATGKELWHYDLGDERTSRITPYDPAIDPRFEFNSEFDYFDYRASRPILADDVIYVGAGDGGLHAIDAQTGARKWRFQAKRAIRGDVLIDGDRIVFGSWGGILYAVDRATGNELWKRETYGVINNTPASIDGKIIVGNRGGLLVAFDPATGKTIWRMNFWGSSVESDAVGADTLFYIGSSDLRRVTLVDARDSRVIWRSDVFGWAWNRVALTEHRLYLGVSGATPYQMRHKGSLVALDRTTGKIAWRWPMPEWPGGWLNGFIASPEIEGKMLVIGGVDGSLYGFPIER